MQSEQSALGLLTRVGVDVQVIAVLLGLSALFEAKLL